MDDIKKIVENISGLSVLELNDLVKQLEDEFGVSAAALAVAAPAGGGGAAGDGGKSEFNVHLAEVGAQKMSVIKLVKEVLGLGLKEAKELVDGAPKVLKENVPDAEAQEMKKKFEEVGAKIELK